MTRIVVGVDGSSHSARALRRAKREAQLRGATLQAVHAYKPIHRSVADDLVRIPIGLGGPVGTVATGETTDGPETEEQEIMRRTEERLVNFIRKHTEGVEGPDPTPVVIASDHPAEALIDASHSADLLVIGTRGHGGFTGMLLGSVAHQAIQHGRCPILILPPESSE